MNKYEFLAALCKGLEDLPRKDMERSVDYYREMIEDRVEDGLTEEEAVAAVGDPADIAAQILTEVPNGKPVNVKIKPRHRLRVWEIILLILGSPVWLPLLAAAAAIILAVYVVIWSVIISLYAVDASLAATALACMLYSVCTGGLAIGSVVLGGGLVLAGLAVLLFLICDLAAKVTLRLTKVAAKGFRACFVRKERAK